MSPRTSGESRTERGAKPEWAPGRRALRWAGGGLCSRDAGRAQGSRCKKLKGKGRRCEEDLTDGEGLAVMVGSPAEAPGEGAAAQQPRAPGASVGSDFQTWVPRVRRATCSACFSGRWQVLVRKEGRGLHKHPALHSGRGRGLTASRTTCWLSLCCPGLKDGPRHLHGLHEGPPEGCGLPPERPQPYSVVSWRASGGAVGDRGWLQCPTTSPLG